MINIIKHGKKKITTTFYKCRCKYCGCEFEATEDARIGGFVIADSVDKLPWIIFSCPDCRHLVIWHDNISIRTEEEFIDYGQLNDSTSEK